jgi:hypothetical protein
VESAEHDGVEYDKIDIDSTDLTVVCVSLGRIVFNFEDVVFFGPMNKRNTNEGGFKNSAMAHYLNDEFLAAFGDIADIMGKTVDGVKITLPTKYEVFGKGVKESNWSDPPQQFEYYRKYKNRIKVQDDDTKWWWLSTPYSASAAYFCHVDHDGHAYYATASSSGGAAPAFCLS